MKSIDVLTVDAGKGAKLMIAGGEYRILVSGEQTGGSYAVIEMTVPPGAGPVPHAHPDFEESFYVLEGEVTFKSESGSYIAKKNSFIAIPKGGIVHHFKNLTDHPAKLLCTVTPAGLDQFFREVSGFMQSAKNDMLPQTEVKSNLERLANKFGQTLYSPNFFD